MRRRASISEPTGIGYETSPYPIVASPADGQVPDLPPGHGGLALQIWVAKPDEPSHLAPMVGVDGQVATYGWGRAVVVLPAGPHVVEVQYGDPMRSAAVDIVAGELTAFQYSPRDAQKEPSARTGRRRPLGTGRGNSALLLALLLAGSELTVGMSVLVQLVGLSQDAASIIVTLIAIAMVIAIPRYAKARRAKERPPR